MVSLKRFLEHNTQEKTDIFVFESHQLTHPKALKLPQVK